MLIKSDSGSAIEMIKLFVPTEFPNHIKRKVFTGKNQLNSDFPDDILYLPSGEIKPCSQFFCMCIGKALKHCLPNLSFRIPMRI